MPTPVTEAAEVAPTTAAADDVPAVHVALERTPRTSLPAVVETSICSVTVPIVAPVAVIVSTVADEDVPMSKPSTAKRRSSVVMPTSAATVAENAVPALVSLPSLCAKLKVSPTITGRTPNRSVSTSDELAGFDTRLVRVTPFSVPSASRFRR
jgi:hypothetical protein